MDSAQGRPHWIIDCAVQWCDAGSGLGLYNTTGGTSVHGKSHKKQLENPKWHKSCNQ